MDRANDGTSVVEGPPKRTVDYPVIERGPKSYQLSAHSLGQSIAILES
jgi:hypothetical protein